MNSFEELSGEFARRFDIAHFPSRPASLYDPAAYFLGLGGKRIRPVMCLMGNELFGEIEPDAWQLATAIELFHNFTLIHDDIMDKAPMRRGKPTVHERYGSATALLAGDVMLVVAYEYINRIGSDTRAIMQLFNTTAKAVCEGQQTDMDFETRERVGLDEYFRMIELKTSVLLAASLQMGSILGGAGCKTSSTFTSSAGRWAWLFRYRTITWMPLGIPPNSANRSGGISWRVKRLFC